MFSESTVWRRWCENAAKYPEVDAIIHWKAGEDPFRWSFSALIAAAEDLAGGLVERNVRRGDVCAIILRHNPSFYPLYLAVCSIGAIPAILAYPNPRLHPDKFRQGIEGMSQRSGLDWIFTERELQPKIEPVVVSDKSTIKGLHYPLEWGGSNLSEADNTWIEQTRGSILPGRVSPATLIGHNRPAEARTVVKPRGAGACRALFGGNRPFSQGQDCELAAAVPRHGAGRGFPSTARVRHTHNAD